VKIIIASDSFKGSCSSKLAAINIEKGVRKVFPDCDVVKLSVADGGEGTVEAMLENCKGELVYKMVTGPDGKPVEASYGVLENGTAIIEMASASGLPIVPEAERDALRATTKGTGELILSALDKGCKKIIIGLGGSATTDGGVGMAQALGYSFRDVNGYEIGVGGKELSKIDFIDTTKVDSRLKDVEFIAACDVTNPLHGKNGAAFVYGPQKGADKDMVILLDYGLQHLEEQVKLKLNKDNAKVPGAGAAGGLGFGVLTFLNGTLNSGIKTVLEAVNFDNYLKETDLVITGEGRIDGQSVNGKVPVGIGELAKEKNIPVLVIAGGIGDDVEKVYEYGIDSVMATVNTAMQLSEAMYRSHELMIDAAERAMRMIKIGMKIK